MQINTIVACIQNALWSKGTYVHKPYPSLSTSYDARLAVLLLGTTTPKWVVSVLGCSLTGQVFDSQIRLFQDGQACVPSVPSQPIWQPILQSCDSTRHKIVTQSRIAIWLRSRQQGALSHKFIIDWLKEQQGGVGCMGCHPCHVTQQTFARVASHTVWPVVFNYQLGILGCHDGKPDPYHYPYL